MSGVWTRTLVYLGLRDEPEVVAGDLPERFVPEDDPHAEHAPARPARPAAAEAGGAPANDRGPSDTASVTPTERDNVLSLRTGDVHVRPASEAPASRAAVIDLTEFDEVESVGSRFRTGQAVVFDLSDADKVTARRVVDFVSGLIYASRGEMTKVGGRAFLVVPSGVTLPASERRRLSDLGYRLPTGSEA